MASRMKAPADFAHHLEQKRALPEKARQGEPDAIEWIRREVDTIILRSFDDGRPFWQARPAEFDVDQADRENVLASDERVLQVYERALVVEEDEAGHEENAN